MGVFQDKFLLEVEIICIWINLRAKYKYIILTVVLILSSTIWYILFVPPEKEEIDPIFDLMLIIISFIIYSVTLYQTSKMENTQKFSSKKGEFIYYLLASFGSIVVVSGIFFRKSMSCWVLAFDVEYIFNPISLRSFFA